MFREGCGIRLYRFMIIAFVSILTDVLISDAKRLNKGLGALLAVSGLFPIFFKTLLIRSTRFE